MSYLIIYYRPDLVLLAHQNLELIMQVHWLFLILFSNLVFPINNYTILYILYN